VPLRPRAASSIRGPRRRRRARPGRTTAGRTSSRGCVPRPWIGAASSLSGPYSFTWLPRSLTRLDRVTGVPVAEVEAATAVQGVVPSDEVHAVDVVKAGTTLQGVHAGVAHQVVAPVLAPE